MRALQRMMGIPLWSWRRSDLRVPTTLTVLASQPSATAEVFTRVLPIVVGIPLDRVDAELVGEVVGRSVWPLLGCGLGIAAIKKRRSVQW